MNFGATVGGKVSFVGTLVVGGYGMQRTEYQLSRLMAFDADIRGTWGCLPKYYPAVLKMVLKKKSSASLKVGQ